MSRESVTDRELEFDRSVYAWLSVYLKGLAMGAADALPGVSGGTIALITGIYERLIGALSSLDPTVLRHVPRLHRRERRGAFLRRLTEMDVPFLVVLGAGAMSALVLVSRVVHAALTEFPALTFAFFFGLIAASAVVLYREVTVESVAAVVASVVGFGVAYYLSDPSLSGALSHTPVVIFVAGAVAITATILPGVSGAFLLLLLGQYEYLSGTLKRFVDLLLSTATGGNPARLVDPTLTVAAFGVGALVSLLTVSRLIQWALDHYRTATLAFLVSLMVGALRTPATEVLAHTEAWTATTTTGILAAGAFGVGAVLLLERYTDDLSY